MINFDMRLVKSYREKVLEKYNIKRLETEYNVSSHSNHKSLISHILNNYDNSRSLYITQTATPDYTKPFSNKIFVSGLALRFSNESIDLINFNKNLIDNKFLLDYLRLQLTYDRNQSKVNSQSKNYFRCLELIYNDYVSKRQTEKANKITDLAILISKNTKNKDLAYSEK